MGTIKNKALETKAKEYQLTPFEANFLKALVVNRNEFFNQMQASIQLYLSSLGFDKLAIKDPENYEFSADLEKGIITVEPKTIDKTPSK